MKDFENLAISHRIIRVVIGLALVFSLLISPASAAYILAISLVAWYPLLTGLIGYDPLYNAIEVAAVKFQNVYADRIKSAA